MLMNLNNLNIANRLKIGFGILVLLLLAIAYAGYSNMTHIQERLDEIVSSNIAKTDALQSMSELAHVVSGEVKNVLVLKEEREIDSAKTKILSSLKHYEDVAQSLSAMESIPEETKSFVTIKERVSQVVSVNHRVIDLAKQAKNEEAITLLFASALPLTVKWQQSIDEAIGVQKKLRLKILTRHMLPTRKRSG